MKNQTNKTQNQQSYDYILEEDVIEVENCDTKYDLAVFSSALHHLRYADRGLFSATRCLNKGAIILTNADPTINIQQFSYKLLSFIDRGINLSIKQPVELISRIRKMIFR